MSQKKGRPEKTEDGFTIVYDHDQLPEFKSEAEENEFWGNHAWSEEMMDKAALEASNYPLPPIRSRQSATSIRFDNSILRRLKSLARRRGVGYQTLLKTFVAERLYEEEKREGVIGH